MGGKRGFVNTPAMRVLAAVKALKGGMGLVPRAHLRHVRDEAAHGHLAARGRHLGQQRLQHAALACGAGASRQA